METVFSIQGIQKNTQQQSMVGLSVPFESGALFAHQSLIATEQLSQQEYPVSFHPLAEWPDKSIKWAKCQIICPIQKGEAAKFSLKITIGANNKQADLSNFEQKSDHSNSQTSLFPSEFNLNSSECCIQLANNSPKNLDWQLQSEEILHVDGVKGAVPEYQRVITSEYPNDVPPSEALPLKIKLVQSWQQGLLKNSLTLHNPNKAQHPDGQWDLGDENSLYIKSAKVIVPFVHSDEIKWKNKSDEEWHNAPSTLNITQHSSGGAQWQSQTHILASGEQPLTVKGFSLHAGDSDTMQGDRIEPMVKVVSEKTQLTAFMEGFWQNFPSAIKVDKQALHIELFPEVDYLHELQPGEQKTHTFWIETSNTSEHTVSSHTAASQIETVTQPLQIQLNPQYVAKTKVVANFSGQQEPQIQALIAQCLKGKNNFFAKREAIDEYGWRNFGELYADHENTEFKGEGLIISHYNNQYDPIYGFLRQYLLTGESQWFELADDLAKHVIDIDIYRTELDKEEYNNGLFWHTDHYVDAATATHRTYSKNQSKDVYMDHAGGGGPGGQHCYTTGLMLYYFLTGNQAAKQTVLNLTEWITHIYDGNNTLFDLLIAYKNRYRADLKSINNGQYPLDRGTGYLLFALIDAFELTGEQRYLDKASMVIKHTVFIDEDISQRHFENVEETWFYTVFLQAMGHYIQIKNTHGQRDESYHYARTVLLQYADWMVEHERPYLTKPEILEFPNQTWTAQDIRKANVLYLAHAFSDQQKPDYLQKADELYAYIIDNLATSDESTFTRILALLMQNEGVKAAASSGYCQAEQQSLKAINTEPLADKNLATHVIERLQSFSLSKEVSGLRKRINKVDELMKKVRL